MSIERDLPENTQRRLDRQAAHWSDVVRRIGSAAAFVRSALTEYALSPQVSEPVTIAQFALLERCLEFDLAYANRLWDSAVNIADGHCTKSEEGK